MKDIGFNELLRGLGFTSKDFYKAHRRYQFRKFFKKIKNAFIFIFRIRNKQQ